MADKIKIRRDKKRKKPNFHRQEYTRRPAFTDGWRAPKGIRSKMRLGKKSKPRVPSCGYGSPNEVKGFHPCGKPEVLVRCEGDLVNVNDNVVVRLARRLGKKKKLEFMKKIGEKIRILNPVKDKSKPVKKK
jgi:large subunit ribosomal protein L32e